MKHIIQGIEPYETERTPMYYGCSANIMSILEFYNPVFHDNITYYFSLMSWWFSYHHEWGMPLGIPTDPLLHRNLQRLYGVDKRQIKNPDFNAFWDSTTSLIEQDRPQLVSVDAYGVSDDLFHDNRLRGMHEFAIVYGFDTGQDKVYLLNNSSRGLFGTVSLSTLQQIVNHEWFRDYIVPNICPKYDLEEIKHIIQMDIGQYLSGDHYFPNISHGLTGVRAFCKEVGGWAERAHDKAIRVKMERCFHELTYVGPQRIYFACALHKLGDILEAPHIHQLAERITRLGQSWVVVRHMLFKGAKKDPLNILPRIQNRLMDIADEEEKVLVALARILDQQKQ